MCLTWRHPQWNSRFESRMSFLPNACLLINNRTGYQAQCNTKVTCYHHLFYLWYKNAREPSADHRPFPSHPSSKLTKTRQWGTKSKRFITEVLHKALNKTGYCCLLTLCILSVCIMYKLFTVPQIFERGERSAVGCGQNTSEILLLAGEDAEKMNQLRRKLSIESPICYEEHYSDIFVNFTAHRISSIKHPLNLHISKGGGTSFCKLAYNAQKVEQKLANRNC